MDECQGVMILKCGTLGSIRDSVSCSAVTQDNKGDLIAQGSHRDGPEIINSTQTHWRQPAELKGTRMCYPKTCLVGLMISFH